MDIPAPKPEEKDVPQKVAVTVTSSKAPEQTTAPATEKASTPNTTDDKNTKIAELISSKKYVLSIKEKRTTPLVTFGFAKTRDRKSRKGTKKVAKSAPKKASTKKVESKKARTIKLSIIALLWIGAYMAIDMGLIDVGWRPPFTIIGPL